MNPKPELVYRDVLGEIKQYLESLVMLRKEMKHAEPKLGFHGPEDWILQKGQVFRNGGVQGTPVPKACFHRSYLAATRKGSKWIYCEGYAANPNGFGIAVQHAWLTKADTPGVAFDAAWPKPEGSIYLGIPFTAEYLKSCRRRSGTCGGVIFDALNYGDDLATAIWSPGMR